MMRTTKKLPEAELEIMLVIWEADGSVTSGLYYGTIG